VSLRIFYNIPVSETVIRVASARDIFDLAGKQGPVDGAARTMTPIDRIGEIHCAIPAKHWEQA